MKLLIKRARITDPLSPHHGNVTDILIEDGRITRIGDLRSATADQTIERPGLHLSPGWVDVFAHFADPGSEHKETLATGSRAAAKGGFTDVFLIPNTKPVIHDKAGVEYIRMASRDLPASLHPLGAISRNTEGRELAEMYDMHQSGAIAFSDGLQPVQQAGLLVKALQYVKAMNAVVIQLPDDHTIQPNGLMNEGIVSTRLGLPGKPALAEELMTARDLKLAAYAASRLHLTAVSTATSIDYIRHARQSGTDITCSATPYHTFFTDSDLAGYDTHFKVNPPLRNEQDRTALRNAFEDGTVDCIATHHLPHETDSKVVEFEYARFGMIGLETAFAACRTAMPELALDKLIACLATNPRRIFGLDPATIKEDAVACLTLFEPDTTWTVTRESLGSKSSNTPFLGNALKGKVTGTVRNGKVHLNA